VVGHFLKNEKITPAILSFLVLLDCLVSGWAWTKAAGALQSLVVSLGHWKTFKVVVSDLFDLISSHSELHTWVNQDLYEFFLKIKL